MGETTKAVVAMVALVVVVVLGMVVVGCEGFEYDEDEYQVMFSVLVTRHGDRTPTRVFNNSKSHWPEGLGMLTGVGMKQLNELGAFMRERYVEKHKLLSPQVCLSEIYARSTPKERTLVSAQSFLMGLYPVGTGPKLPTSDLFALPNGFQPIPLYSSMPKADDVLYTHKNCEKLGHLAQEVRTSEEWLKFENDPENVQLFEFLSEIYGEKISFKHSSTIRALIKAERTHNRETFFGSKITEEMYNKIEQLAEEAMLLKYGTKEMGKLAGGNLVQEILRLIAQHSTELKDSGIRPPRSHASKKAKPKFVYFSAHDSTLLAMFSAIHLQRPDLYVPRYASYVVFELRNSSTKGEHVVMIYDGRAITIPGCEQIGCPVKRFKEVIETKVEDDWEWALSCAVVNQGGIGSKVNCNNFPIDHISITTISITIGGLVLAIVLLLIKR